MKRIVWIFGILIILLIICTLPASANWRGGVWIGTFKGLSAKISTPFTPPKLVVGPEVSCPDNKCPNGISNWVSTLWKDAEGDSYWIQAGWRYRSNFTEARRYWEICNDCNPPYFSKGILYLDDTNSPPQAWGTKTIYWVNKRDGGNNEWRAYYEPPDGITRIMARVSNLHPYPLQMAANGEIHNDSKNEIDTLFEDLRYQDIINSLWYLVTDESLAAQADFPYVITMINPNYKFRITRGAPKENFVPSVTD